MSLKVFSFQGDQNADFQLTHQIENPEHWKVLLWRLLGFVEPWKNGHFDVEMSFQNERLDDVDFSFILILDINHLENLIYINNSAKKVCSPISLFSMRSVGVLLSISMFRSSL